MITNLFFVLLAALLGGLVAKLLKFPSLVGYIVAGVLGGLIFSFDHSASQNIAEIGVILLLFSVGLELSFERLLKVGKIAILGSILQIILFTGLSFFFLTAFFHMAPNPALVLSLAFSLSSTALIVKILSERAEEGTIHYEILTGWALVQDLAVIPIVVLLPTLASTGGTSWLNLALGSILTTVLVLGIVFLVGKLIAPYLTHLVAATNNRELLILLAITLALGTASMVTMFGISAAFGAFLAGVVISKTQENHAIFAETRPLRDIFSILFFVSLGFLVTPLFIFTHFSTILILAVFIIILKALITFLICILFGYRGRTAIAVSLGIAQVGEFAFILFLIAGKLGILSQEISSLATATTLVSLLIAPFLFKAILPLWHKLKPFKIFSGGLQVVEDRKLLTKHIIICGYGRMGKWIGKALKEIGIEFTIIDYNRKVVHDALVSGTPAIYGDASFPEVLKASGIKSAKALIITLPDRVAQEEIINFSKLTNPDIKIIARAHLDTDIKKLGNLKVHKVVQPEFEAALAVVRNILINSGHSKEDVAKKMKGLRLSHASH